MSARRTLKSKSAPSKKHPIDDILDFGDSDHVAPTAAPSDSGVHFRLLKIVKQMREIQERVDRLLSKI